MPHYRLCSRFSAGMRRHRNYAGALQCYQRALEAAGGADAVLLSNVAVAHLGLEQWEEVRTPVQCFCIGSLERHHA